MERRKWSGTWLGGIQLGSVRFHYITPWGSVTVNWILSFFLSGLGHTVSFPSKEEILWNENIAMYDLQENGLCKVLDLRSRIAII